ncbi:MAG: UDP-2,4-diacetamido-2,4,6-trideoxy-beta-L-altropyranose hydrolase [Lachnospiraceae bacterium]|nr:UDP-2,4-diacetamido-2,4,6-trideoxy-beta-L-altropyranose hydrolase [Lachnospiraceae bacterium]
MEKMLIVIPARGGSKGIPRKNIRFMAGKPLISYAIGCAKECKFDTDIIVSTDDEEIKYVATRYGASIVERPSSLAGDSVTLDPVIFHAANKMEEIKGYKYDLVITMQPTSPKLSSDTLNKAIDYLLQNNYDTVISGVNDPRLSWRIEDGKCIPNYEKRLNRQYLPKDLKETGAFVITRREFVKETGRFGANVSLYEVPESESGDIDTVQDWCVAEMELNKKTILLRVDGYPQIGMGHIYRGLQIAYGLMEHKIYFVLSEKSEIGIAKIQSSHYPYEVIKDDDEILDLIDRYKADVVINDILNTTEEYVQKLKDKGVRVVNFEDLGTGSLAADATVNALYDGENTDKLFFGSDYYLIRDEFVIAKPKEFAEKPEEILVLFGGTDPRNLTQKTIKALMTVEGIENIHITVILGMGYDKKDEIVDLTKECKNITIVQDVKLMSDYMSKADIAIASQGRTMLELAAMGVPTILMSQNSREATHEFGGIKNGYLNLGAGNEVDEVTIGKTVDWLINCPSIRKNMREQMLTRDLRHGLTRVKKIILGRE